MMKATQGRSTLSRMLDFLRANPGSTAPAIRDALSDIHGPTVVALISDAIALKRVFRCGMRGLYIYFADEDQAAAAEPAYMESLYQAGRQRLRRKHEREHAKRMQRAGKTPWEKIGKRAEAMPLYAAMDTEILRRAESAEGFAIRPMTIGERQFSNRIVGNRVITLVRQDLLFRGKLSHRFVRFFRTEHAADAWILANGGGAACAAPVTVKRLPLNPTAQVIVPPHVKVQKIPHAPGRYEVHVPKGRGQISQDHYLMRQGVDVRAVLAGEVAA